jgi:hypothetical protein
VLDLRDAVATRQVAGQAELRETCARLSSGSHKTRRDLPLTTARFGQQEAGSDGASGSAVTDAIPSPPWSMRAADRLRHNEVGDGVCFVDLAGPFTTIR